MNNLLITDEIVEHVSKAMTDKGRGYFKKLWDEHGNVSPILILNGFPYVVHFRDGMRVRNIMRESGLCDDWTAHDFDNNWMEVVEKVIGVQR